MEAQKRKILLVITKSNWGGAQRYVHDLATSIPKESFDVAVAFGGTGEANASPGKLEQKLKEQSIRTIFIKAFMRDISIMKEFFALFELMRIFRREKPDIVHLNSSKAGGVGALAARIVGVKKIIFTSHGLAYDEDRNIFARALIFFATWLTFLLCHRVIVICKDNLIRASRLPFCKPKITLIYNGISTFEFLSREEARAAIAARANSAIPPDAICIGTIAELTQNKGLSYVVEAAKILNNSGNNFSVVVIGDGDKKTSLANEIIDAKLKHHINLIGFLEDASRYLRAFDIFVLPSVKEGLPYVLMEAGLASLPVVASDIPGIQDIIEDRFTGLLFKPKDSSAFAQKLSILMQDADMQRFFADKLKQKIDNQFSVSKMSANTLKLYTGNEANI